MSSSNSNKTIMLQSLADYFSNNKKPICWSFLSFKSFFKSQKWERFTCFSSSHVNISGCLKLPWDLTKYLCVLGCWLDKSRHLKMSPSALVTCVVRVQPLSWIILLHIVRLIDSQSYNSCIGWDSHQLCTSHLFYLLTNKSYEILADRGSVFCRLTLKYPNYMKTTFTTGPEINFSVCRHQHSREVKVARKDLDYDP